MRASPHVSSICRHQQPSVSSSTPLLTAAEGRPAYALCHTGGAAFMRQIIQVPAQQGWICQPGPLPQRTRHEAPSEHPHLRPFARFCVIQAHFCMAGAHQQAAAGSRAAALGAAAGAAGRQEGDSGVPRAVHEPDCRGGEQERQGATRHPMGSSALGPGFAQVSSFPCPDRNTVRHHLEPCTTP